MIAPTPPDRSNPRFAEYAEKWLAWRKVSGRTRAHYRRLVERHLLPTFGSAGLRDVSTAAVNAWYADVAANAPSVGAHCYSLLRSIMKAAVIDNLIEANPCQISGVSTSRGVDGVRPITGAEVDALAAAMPPAYRALVLMAEQ